MRPRRILCRHKRFLLCLVLVLIVDTAECVLVVQGPAWALTCFVCAPEAFSSWGRARQGLPICGLAVIRSHRVIRVGVPYLPMILDNELWLVSLDTGICFWRTKSPRMIMNALSGRGCIPLACAGPRDSVCALVGVRAFQKA